MIDLNYLYEQQGMPTYTAHVNTDTKRMIILHKCEADNPETLVYWGESILTKIKLILAHMSYNNNGFEIDTKWQILYRDQLLITFSRLILDKNNEFIRMSDPRFEFSDKNENELRAHYWLLGNENMP